MRRSSDKLVNDLRQILTKLLPFIHSTLNWPIVKSEKLKIEYFRFDI